MVTSLRAPSAVWSREMPSWAFLPATVYDRIWERIREEKSLTAQWSGAEVADYGLTLYMPVLDSGGDS